MAKPLWQQLLDGTYDPLARVTAGASSRNDSGLPTWQWNEERQEAERVREERDQQINDILGAAGLAPAAEHVPSWQQTLDRKSAREAAAEREASIEDWLDAGRGRTPELAGELSSLERQQQRAEAAGLGEDGEGPTGVLQSIMDVIDKPRQAVFGALTNRDIGGLETFEGFGTLAPLRFDENDAWYTRAGKAVGAFAGDVLTDPLTYLTFGSGAVARQVAGQAGKKALQKTGRAALKEAPDAAKREFAQRVDRGVMRTRVSDASGVEKGVIAQMSPDDTWRLAVKHGQADELAIDGLVAGAVESYLRGTSRGFRSFLDDVVAPTLGRDNADLIWSRAPHELKGGARLRIPFSRTATHEGIDLGIGLPQYARLTPGGGQASKLVPGLDPLLNLAERARMRTLNSGLGQGVIKRFAGEHSRHYGELVANMMASNPETVGRAFSRYDSLIATARKVNQLDSGMDKVVSPLISGLTRTLDKADDPRAVRKHFAEAVMDRGTYAPEDIARMSGDRRLAYEAAQAHHDTLAYMWREARKAGIDVGYINDYVGRMYSEAEAARQAVRRPGRRGKGAKAQPEIERTGVWAEWEIVPPSRRAIEAAEAAGEPYPQGTPRIARWKTPDEVADLAGREVFETDPLKHLSVYVNRMSKAIKEHRFVTEMHRAGLIQDTGTTQVARDFGPNMARVGHQAIEAAQAGERAILEGFEHLRTTGSASKLTAALEGAGVSATDGLPAVAKGHTRLWRGATDDVSTVAVADGTEAFRGRYFTPDRRMAQRYADDIGGDLRYVDVPDEVVRAARSEDTPEGAMAALKALTEATDEVILPAEYAARQRSVAAAAGRTVDMPDGSKLRVREVGLEELPPDARTRTYARPDGTTFESAQYKPPTLPTGKRLPDAAEDYIASRGIKDAGPAPDLSLVEADPVMGAAIRDAYDAMPRRDVRANPAYRAMAQDVEDQYRYLTEELGIRVQVVKDDPYETIADMVADVARGRIKVLSTETTGGHPFFSNELNDKFRAVHDVFGHAAVGRSFDRHGEEAAWLAHRRMFSVEGRKAMTTETRGQNSSLNFGSGEFPPQKVGLLPDELQQPTSAKRWVVEDENGRVLEHFTSEQGAGAAAQARATRAQITEDLDTLWRLMDPENIHPDPRIADQYLDDIVHTAGRWLEEDPAAIRAAFKKNETIRDSYGRWLAEQGDLVDLTDAAVNERMLAALQERGAFGPASLARSMEKMYAAHKDPTDLQQFMRAVYKPWFQWFKTQATVAGGPRFFIRNGQSNVFLAWLVDTSPRHFGLSLRFLDQRQTLKRQVRKELGVRRSDIAARAEVDQLVNERLPEHLRKNMGEQGEKLARVWEAFERQRSTSGLRVQAYGDAGVDPGSTGLDVLTAAGRRQPLRPDLLPEERGVGVRVGERSIDNFVVGGLLDATEGTETWNRFAVFLKGAEEFGLDDGGYAAYLGVLSTMFDYGDLAEFEIRYMKNLMPFYTWARKNLPLQARATFKDPGKVKRVLHANEALAGQYGAQDEDGGEFGNAIMPRWVRESFGWEFRQMPPGKYPWAMNLGWWPTSDLNRTFTTRGINQQEAMSQLNPLATVAYETLTGTRTFTRAEFQPIEAAPLWMRPFARTAGGEKVTSPRAMNVLRGLAPPVSHMDRLIDPAVRQLTGTVNERDRYVDRWGTTVASMVFGLPVSTLDAGQQTAQARSQAGLINRALRTEFGYRAQDAREIIDLVLEHGGGPDEVDAALKAAGLR